MIAKLIIETLIEKRPELALILIFDRDGAEIPDSLRSVDGTVWIAINPATARKPIVCDDDAIRLRIFHNSGEHVPATIPWQNIRQIRCPEVGAVTTFQPVGANPGAN